MKKITVISGKGGTGKTSLVGAFASLAGGDVVLVDGDVDAANLSLITGSDLLETHEFYASKVADIDREKCNSCGLCLDLCRFEAISKDYLVDPVNCEGCSFCAHACPEGAINMREKTSGQWYVSDTNYGTLVHARLGIAEENSGKLVTTIRNRGQEVAEAFGKKYLLIDGPPGIGCPVIASLAGVDKTLIVTEPSVSGIHDLERVIALCRHFEVSAAVCINRYDLAETQTARIEDYCCKEGIPLAGKLPFNRSFVEAMVQGKPVTEGINGTLFKEISIVWEKFLKK
ncbi:MAG: ATP-binding protein [Bacillota bacterium]